ncbi:flagellar hook-associated protein FlgK [Lacimonas salitolerans]|uniref:Flagellar hook-associated protein 1 n=1 Tax=Lacimonas salitolerans TaxID=1323750 RepID=A0ABW4EJ39_9RHOB
MASLLEIGRSAINAQREALNVTGQNIVNVNTEGYRKRDANLVEVSGVQSELTALTAQTGLGVQLGEVRRAYDSFLTDSKRTASGRFESSVAFVQKLERLQNTVLPNDGDLGTTMTAFFDTLGQVAARPGDLAPRAAAIEMGRTISNAFNTTASLLDELGDGTFDEISTRLNDVNQNLSALASVNGKLRSSNLGGNPPNTLLDERDRLIDRLSSMVPVSVAIGNRFEAEVRLGASDGGPIIVTGEDSKVLSAGISDQGNIFFRVGAGQTVSQLETGGLRGLVDAYGTTRRASNELDMLARNFSTGINAQHSQGIDLDSQLGREMFAVAQFSATAGRANEGTAEATIRLVPGRADSLDRMQMTYTASTDRWILKDDAGTELATGRTRLEIDGAVIDVTGTPEDGDTVTFTRDPGDAARIAFLLERPEEIAASSTTVISPDTTNLGSAALTSQPAVGESSGIAPLTDVLANNLSPVAAQELLRGGVIGSIPRGTKDITLASLATQATASIAATVDADIGAFTLTLDGDDVHSFDVRPSDVFKLKAGEVVKNNWESGAEIAKYLDMGVVESDKGKTLADLGISVAGSATGLAFASDGSRSLTAASAVSSTGASIGATVTQGQQASDIRVFTREGRQIAGIPLDTDEVANLLTVDNGFTREAEYRADYNSVAGGVGYRGIDVTQSQTASSPLTGGAHKVSANLIGLSAATGTTLSEGNVGISLDSNVNQTQGQTITLDMATGFVRSATIPAGADAALIADRANASFAPVGVRANAMTALRLSLDPSATDGSVQFDLGGLDGDPLTISAQISNGDLNALVSAVNRRSDDTGITAEVSLSGDAVTLVQDDGFDIAISNISPNGVGFDAVALDQEFNPLSLGGTPTSAIPFLNEMRVSGTVSFLSSSEFEIRSDATGAETLTSASEPVTGGLVAREFSNGGTAASLVFNIDPMIDGPSTSVDGTNVHAPSSRYEAVVTADNGSTFTASVSAADLTPGTLSGDAVAQAMAAELRAQAPVPTLTGAARAIGDFPPVGTTARFMLGGAEYTLRRVEGGDPTRLTALDFEITGPENGRLVPRVDEVDGDFALSLGVVGGQLSGAGPVPVSESTAAQFGLSTAQTTSSLQGRAIASDLPNGAYIIDVSLGGVSGSVTVTKSATGLIPVPAGLDNSLQAEIENDDDGTDFLVLSAKQTGLGQLSVTGGDDATALGLRIGTVGLTVDAGVLNARSTTASAIDVVAGATSTAGSYLRLSDLPDEELIVVMSDTGAKRIAAQFEIGSPSGAGDRKPENFRVEMMDDGTSRVELFDVETGASIATRTSNGLARFNVSGQDVELSGFAETGDTFTLVTGRRSPGDARNLDEMLNLGQQRTGFKSYQDEFRAIAAGIGATLEAARLTRTSNEAVYEAAVASESELSGVNLDEEAAKLIAQQQAYQAAARILQTAREMFDTLIRIS